MLKIGITGGIGSGKTTVCRVFETLGIPVYYADERAKWLMVNDAALMEGIRQLFGAEAYLEDGSLNRQHIAQIAFNDPEKLKELNALVHPAVFRDGERWNQEQEQAGVPYTLKEAALIFESGSHHFLDKVITVYAPRALRLARVKKRDNADEEAILARMDKQMAEEEKLERADFVVYNDGTRSLIKQVLDIHHKLLAHEI